MKHRCTVIFLLVSAFIFTAAVTSCSKTDKAAFFQQKLHDIDVLVQEGNTQTAAIRLQKLRKNAAFPAQYLSIAKRELQLDIPVQALQSLQAGLKQHPDDGSLKAALVHMLLTENRVNDAVSYAESLAGTAYAGLGAETFIIADHSGKSRRTPIDFWREGFRLTGEHVFLENAALMFACRGEITAAASLRSYIPKDEAVASPYFWSCLAYDMGNFMPVLDDLVYSLAYADMAGLEEHDPRAFEYARRHLLLAADANAGLNNIEQARAFWQDYADRYPDAASDVLYNLAMTAPSEKEKITALIDCITADPSYYPAAAQYVRAWLAMRKANIQKNTLTEFLQSKDFFSLEMEKSLFLSSTFTLSADQVLQNALHVNPTDPHFLLEHFRYKYAEPKNYAQGNGEMWKIREKIRGMPLIDSYARWYFARFGDFNACFSIERTGEVNEDSFYDGLRYAMQGTSTAALAAFAKAENDAVYACPAVVNQGYIYAARGEPDIAIKYFMRASDMTVNAELKSKLLCEAAILFAERNGVPEALNILKQALVLDPENRRAAVLQQKLQKAS